MGLIEQGAGYRHLRICEDRIPAGLLVLKPAPDPLTIGGPSRGSDVVRKVAQALTQRKYPQALALTRPVPQRVELGAQGFADRGGDGCQFLRELIERVAQTIAEARSWKERPHALGGAIEAIGEDPFDL